MIKSFTRIETIGGKVYELPGDKNTPQLWEVSLSIRHIDEKTGLPSGPFGEKAEIHVEREVLEDHGLLPMARGMNPEPAPTKTAEDLILELLELVGVYPQP